MTYTPISFRTRIKRIFLSPTDDTENTDFVSNTDNTDDTDIQDVT